MRCNAFVCYANDKLRPPSTGTVPSLPCPGQKMTPSEAAGEAEAAQTARADNTKSKLETPIIEDNKAPNSNHNPGDAPRPKRENKSSTFKATTLGDVQG